MMAEEQLQIPYAAPDVSRDLLPAIVDRLAQRQGNSTFISYCEGEDVIRVTHRDFANAVDNTAWWLHRELGPSHRYEGLAFFGTGGCDIRYAIVLVAAVKVGYYSLFNSPRNSIETHVSLFQRQKCTKLVTATPEPSFVGALLEAYPMSVFRMPQLDDLFNNIAPEYVWTKSFDEARNTPLVALHTSGSTGLPSPVCWTLEAASVTENACMAPTSEGMLPLGQIHRDELTLSAMPSFHAAGLHINVLAPLYCAHKIVLSPPGPPLGADAASSLIRRLGVTAAVLPPSTVDEIGKRLELLQRISDVKYVIFGGGGISSIAAEALNGVTKLVNVLGSTEIGISPLNILPKEDWACFKFNPCAGVDFRQFSGDEYELVMVRDANLDRYQSVFKIFPDITEFYLHDLFLKHPSKTDVWLYKGRSDDIIVFLNGEKTNPTAVETFIGNRNEVRSALIIGNGRLEAALLLELSDPKKLSTKEKAVLLESLWPTIEEANRLCPAYAKVSKSLVMFTSPDKPMSRASKGSIQRKATIAAYASEIDSLYSGVESACAQDSMTFTLDAGIDEVLVQAISRATGVSDLAVDEDFFARGVDSRQVLQIVRALRYMLRESEIEGSKIAPSLIYSNPSIKKLAAAVTSLKQPVHETTVREDRNREAVVNSVLRKLSVCPASSNDSHARSVILTGSTGSLGCYLLDALLKAKDVARIYCLNRSPNSHTLQSHRSGQKSLQWQSKDGRVKFLTANVVQPDFGLCKDDYTYISATVTVIIHNAWEVNFHQPLGYYEQVHLPSIQNLIKFSNNSLYRAKIFFISSTSAVMGWSARHTGEVPESIIEDATVPHPMGYAESKHIAERMLAQASSYLHIPISICRVGQIAGPVESKNGMWNTSEWFPSVIKSSQHLGLLPDYLFGLDAIDWIPIDLLAPILITLAFESSGEESSCKVFHAVNPNATTWQSLLPQVVKLLNGEIRIVPVGEWLLKIRQSAAVAINSKLDLQASPALKLVDLLEDMVNQDVERAVVSTTETVKASPALKEMGPVRESWMERWIEQWNVTSADT